MSKLAFPAVCAAMSCFAQTGAQTGTQDASQTHAAPAAAAPPFSLEFCFDPEIAGGRGFSGVNGLANASHGELPRYAPGYAWESYYNAQVLNNHDRGPVWADSLRLHIEAPR